LSLLGIGLGQLLNPAPLKMAAEANFNKLTIDFTRYMLENPEMFNEENPCNEDLLKGVNNFLGDDSIFTLAAHTGLNANELGDYRNCLKSGWKFFYLQVAFQGIPIMFNGVCLPARCKTQYLLEIRKGIAYVLSALAKMPITEEYVNMLDVREELDKHTKFDDMSYLTVGLMLGMLFLCIIGTIILYFYKDKQSLAYKICKCFDLAENAKNIAYGENSVDPNLNVLNGIRTLAMYWIIGGHCFEVMSGLLVPIINPLEAFNKIQNERSYAYYLSGTLAVDVFFFLTAFLGVLVGDHQIKTSKSNKVVTVLMLYLHRFVRLIPLYGLTILCGVHVITKLYEGPLYYLMDMGPNSTYCKENWIYNLLFINNYFGVNEQCLGWSWYLSNDFQMYILLPIIVILYQSNKFYGLLSVAGLFVISCISQIFVFTHWDFSLNILTKNKPNFRGEYYIKPYCRINPFLVGIIFAWLYQAYKEKENGFPIFSKINKIVTENPIIRYSLYIVGLISIYCCVYLYFDFYKQGEDKNMLETLVYGILARPCFVIALMLIFYPVMLGRTPILQGIFGNEFFGMMSKLTFAAYLFHPYVVIFHYGSMEESIYFRGYKLAMIGLECFVITYILAFFLSLIIETPLTLLSKEFLRPAKSTKPAIKSKENLTENEELLKKKIQF